MDRYIGWVHLRVGDLLREECANCQDTKWSDIASMVDNGHLAPTVKKFHWLHFIQSYIFLTLVTYFVFKLYNSAALVV